MINTKGVQLGDKMVSLIYRYFWLHHHQAEYTPEKITSVCDLKKSCLRDQKGSQNKENIYEKFHDGESFPEKVRLWESKKYTEGLCVKENQVGLQKNIRNYIIYICIYKYI